MLPQSLKAGEVSTPRQAGFVIVLTPLRRLSPALSHEKLRVADYTICP